MPTSADTAASARPDRPGPTFTELGVAAELVEALGELGIREAFSIQELAVPIALDGRDIIGQARTGMGKTYAFGLPLLDLSLIHI